MRTSFISALMRKIARPITDPYRRYRNARLIHSARISVGLLASILLTTGFNLPHGEWASVTMLVVIGGLQHHGNIRRKAAERAVGTLIGAGLGLLLVIQHNYMELAGLTYVLMSICCGFFAYHAIGKGGYTALLAAITLFVVAGHGENPVSDGIWRGVNILIGIALALIFSFALPLYAFYSWRYNLSGALRDCATIHRRIITGLPVTDDEHQKLINRLNKRMVEQRSLMPSASKEMHVSMTRLDAIQRSLRMCISTLEILAHTRPEAGDSKGLELLQSTLAPENKRIRVLLLGMARALRLGSAKMLNEADHKPEKMLALEAAAASGMAGYVLLTFELSATLETLRQQLADTAKRWKAH
ncbi:Fusaric acid resistance protein family protein [Pseudomonas segetis]|uniref:Fusaric acid resistance protein family protein n=2 Tax=Pseudomonas segetis TaxID=298908 RepID=A0A238ZRQ8_9PSED|nr:Fusaric acid resistance protein family protein [Pseudomonas segetis]